MPNFAYTDTGAAYTYQGNGDVMGNGPAYGTPAVIHGQAHFAVVGWVIFAIIGLILLDKGGFKFVFLAGRG
jgi:hypothetical protein